MLGILVSKFHQLVPVVENKDPHRLHARLEQTPSGSHLQNSTRHITLLWERNYFYTETLLANHKGISRKEAKKGFIRGRPDGAQSPSTKRTNETIFKRWLCQVDGDQATVSRRQNCDNRPLFITYDNSPDKSITHGITNKLTTDIHTTLSLLRYQFIYSFCMIFQMSLVLFLRIFFQNSAYILNIP